MNQLSFLAGKEPLVDLISELGGWKLANIPESKAWSFDQLWQAHLKGGPAFFSMAISADAKNSDKQSIYVRMLSYLAVMLSC